MKDLFLFSERERKAMQEFDRMRNFHAYGDDDWTHVTPLHEIPRGRYSTGLLRCSYCWVIPEHSWGKCTQCGAPL